MLTFFKILIPVFGLFELTTNLFYFSNENRVALAYNQHREIPPTVTARRMRLKMSIMLVVGCIFLLAGVYACLVESSTVAVIRTVLCGYAAYTIGEAIYYRSHIMGWVLASLITVLAILTFML